MISRTPAERIQIFLPWCEFHHTGLEAFVVKVVLFLPTGPGRLIIRPAGAFCSV